MKLLLLLLLLQDLYSAQIQANSSQRRYAYLNVWRIFTIAGIGNFLDFSEKWLKLFKIF